MEAICLQEKINKNLSICEKIIGRNITHPILNNILISTEKGYLKISATDLEIAINIWIPSKIEKQGSVSIPAKLISNFINNLPSNKKIYLDTKNNNLKIKCENYHALIQGSNAEEFPIIPKIEEKKFITIDNQKFCQGLNQVVNIAALSESKPEISGVFVNIQNKEIKLVATDSFRLAEKNIFRDEKTDQNLEIIVPARTIQEVIRIFDGISGDLQIFMKPGQVKFSLDNIEIISRLIEGEYPAYSDIIPKTFGTNLILNKEEFINEIKVNSIFTGKNNDIKLNIFPKKSQIEISAKEASLGESKSVLKGEITGEELEILFNYKYLLDGLSNISTPKVILQLNSEINPGLLKPERQKDYIYIMMPVKNV